MPPNVKQLHMSKEMKSLLLQKIHLTPTEFEQEHAMRRSLIAEKFTADQLGSGLIV
jgi:hypothetical protein